MSISSPKSPSTVSAVISPHPRFAPGDPTDNLRLCYGRCAPDSWPKQLPCRSLLPDMAAFSSARAAGREETDMAGDKIGRVAAIGTGTIGASWTAVFLARGLTVAASDPAPGAETFLREFVGA